MFDKKSVKRKDITEKEFRKMSNEEKAKLELQQAREEMSNLKKELDNNPQAQEFLKAMSSLFGGIEKTMSQYQTGAEEEDEIHKAIKINTDATGSVANMNRPSGAKSEDEYGSVLDRLRDIDFEKAKPLDPLPEYVPQDYEFDFDPKIISYLFSLDGAGYTGSGNSLKIDMKTNPTTIKQWTNTNNPLLDYPGLKHFFYRYLSIDEENDEKRVRFVDEEVEKK